MAVLPAEGSAGSLPLAPLPEFDIIEITTHRQLIVAVREVARRVAAHPSHSAMFAINPVLALESYGVKLTPELRDHVLRSIKHPPDVRSRRQELERSLEHALGEVPRPEHPEWLARTLFGKLRIAPLDTTGATPVYEPPLNAEIVARVQALRVKPKPKYPPARPGTVRSSIGLAPWVEKVRFLDLTAPVPALPAAATAPRTITIDEAWFYKNTSLIAHELVELGSIQRTGLLFHLPESYRQIAAGTKPNVFRSWIRSLRFAGAEP